MCASIYELLLKYLKRPIDAALSAIIIFSLPAFEVWSFHAGQSFEFYALIFVIIAGYAVDKIPLEGKLWGRIAGYHSLVSILLLICSYMIYPALTTFYWAMALVLILAQMENDSQALRSKIENIYFSGITATLLYAFIYKFRKTLFHLHGFSIYHPDTLVSNIVDKFLWFIFTVLPQSLNLWNIFPSKVLPVLIVLLLVGAITITLVKELNQRQEGIWLKVILWFLISSTITILSYLPNLLSVINFNPYRCGAGLTAVCAIFLIWALKTCCGYIPKLNRSNVMTLILCMVCFWGVFRCFNNIDRFRARISHMEYAFITDSIINFHGNIKEIYFIPPHFNALYHYYDEFGVSTFSFDRYINVVDLINAVVVDASVQNGMEWIGFQSIRSPEDLKAVVNKYCWDRSTSLFTFKKRISNNKTIYPSLELKIDYGDKVNTKLSNSTLLIDMNNLFNPLKELMGQYYNFKVINQRSSDL